MITLLSILSMLGLPSFAQGTSGGGTGDAFNKTVDQETIRQYLKVARGDLYIASVLGYGGPVPERFKDLYSSKNPLPELIKKIGIYDSGSLPCYGKVNEPADASIYSPVPGTICVSSSRIFERKFSIREYKIQIVAILAHEYSHLKGYDETKARMYQKMMMNYVDHLLPWHFHVDIFDREAGIKHFIRSKRKRQETWNWLMDKKLQKVPYLDGYANVLGSFYPDDTVGLDDRQKERANLIILRFYLLEQYLCTRSKWRKDGWAECRFNLEKFFSQKDSFNTNDYIKNGNYGNPIELSYLNLPKNITINRIKNDEDLKKEIDRALHELEIDIKDNDELFKFYLLPDVAKVPQDAKHPAKLERIKFDDIVRKGNAQTSSLCPKSKPGEICLMSYIEAVNYCSSIGKRLPTVFELAHHIPHLKKNLRETEYFRSSEISEGVLLETAGMLKNGFIPFYEFDENRDRRIVFYYNDQFKSPAGSTCQLVWTSYADDWNAYVIQVGTCDRMGWMYWQGEKLNVQCVQ